MVLSVSLSMQFTNYPFISSHPIHRFYKFELTPVAITYVLCSLSSSNIASREEEKTMLGQEILRKSVMALKKQHATDVMHHIKETLQHQNT